MRELPCKLQYDWSRPINAEINRLGRSGNKRPGEILGFSERTLDAEFDDPGLKGERRERWPRFSEWTLDAEVDDAGLKNERRERWPSRDPPPRCSQERRVGHSQHYRED
ncbi:hypothetical protein TNCV_3304811 [Trichonephila clavipes]|nr:hypothetical protein TNCV_3304811 [Trichonephila clavipes]